MSVSAATAQLGTAVDASAGPRLSTDFLNRYNEALMLIELALLDDGAIDDLRQWSGLGYREHFQVSSLRCAAAALAAYEGLDPTRRQAFESVCGAMTRLVATVTALLAETPRPPELPIIVEVAGDALRKLIGRSTQFINANGAVDIGAVEDRSLQAEVDLVLASLKR